MNPLERPVHYRSITEKINIWQSLVRLITHGEWTRTIVKYEAVRYGEHGYDEAPYSIGIIFHELDEKDLDRHRHR